LATISQPPTTTDNHLTTMSAKKQITMGDLRAALRPILDVVEKVAVQNEDLVNLVSDLSVKLDQCDLLGNQGSKSSGSKKKASPPKRRARKKAEPVSDDEDVVDEVLVDSGDEEKAPPKKRSVKKAPPKKKSPGKKKKSSGSKKKASLPNKKVFFMLKIQEDPGFFDEWVLEDREALEEENGEEWGEEDSKEYRAALGKALYPAMSTKENDKHLQALKKEYHDSIKLESTVIEETEDSP
jgi:hypothetical protein